MPNDCEFTIEESLTIQKRHLNELACVLKPEIMNKLYERALHENAKLKPDTDPYSVWRGGDIDCYVSSIKMQLSRGVDLKKITITNDHGI